MRRRALLLLLPAGLLAACQGREELAATPVQVVFFQDDSADPPPVAMQVIQDAAALAQRFPAAPIRVLGYSAPDNSPIVGLSRTRAECVAAELVRFGVPRERIGVQGRGPVPFEMAPVEARRVEIHVGG